MKTLYNSCIYHYGNEHWWITILGFQFNFDRKNSIFQSRHRKFQQTETCKTNTNPTNGFHINFTIYLCGQKHSLQLSHEPLAQKADKALRYTTPKHIRARRNLIIQLDNVVCVWGRVEFAVRPKLGCNIVQSANSAMKIYKPECCLLWAVVFGNDLTLWAVLCWIVEVFRLNYQREVLLLHLCGLFETIRVF